MMEYKVESLKADANTGVVFMAYWRLTHEDDGFTATRTGEVEVPSAPTAVNYSTVTEAQANEILLTLLTPEFRASLEQSVIDEIELKQNPPVLWGTPWPVDPEPQP